MMDHVHDLDPSEIRVIPRLVLRARQIGGHVFVGEDLQYVEKGGYGFLQAFGISREASEGEKGIPEIILRARPTAWIHEARPFALRQSAVARKRNADGTAGEVLLEVLAGGRCTTIPPSLNTARPASLTATTTQASKTCTWMSSP